MTKYLVKTGLDYKAKGKPVRREPGAEVGDLPAKSIEWLLARGHIVPIEDEKKEES